jgi:hypothetical protein
MTDRALCVGTALIIFGPLGICGCNIFFCLASDQVTMGVPRLGAIVLVTGVLLGIAGHASARALHRRIVRQKLAHVEVSHHMTAMAAAGPLSPNRPLRALQRPLQASWRARLQRLFTKHGAVYARSNGAAIVDYSEPDSPGAPPSGGRPHPEVATPTRAVAYNRRARILIPRGVADW